MSKSNNKCGKELLGVGRLTRGKSPLPFSFSLYFIVVGLTAQEKLAQLFLEGTRVTSRRYLVVSVLRIQLCHGLWEAT